MARWNDTPKVEGGSWTNRFGGIEWRYDSSGIYIRDRNGTVSGPQRTSGAPITCQSIIDHFEAILIARSIEYGIPPELLIMTIATEAASYRKVGFTGQLTFRWEPHVKVNDDPPSFRGDYSLGPMQTLATTARWVIRVRSLPYNPLEVFPAIRTQPDVAPEEHPGYSPDINIHIGVSEIFQRWPKTGENPILVSAIFNAGGIYDASNPNSRYFNRWHIRSYGNHLDRASRWFGDACYVVSSLRS
jgi:peptidoglycan L-alanyl-D-glutamate endopeptidase CwlK